MHALCNNPHGFFWAGDTAQQITSTAFRFADLKSFLFRLEVRMPQLYSSDAAHQCD
jgi:hypothetical protein